ncbi:alpha-amylase family glycosyl hydrolase [Heliophilum fasciatum]|nr:alpha-amylase family glycosyl hydrolase [Heliophilum fasciatum]MCW2279044.1 glycosidase [Heliophilum fasciatum]
MNTPWMDDAVIYQIYLRVYGEEKGKFGTFTDVQEDLPRLRDLGINTIWLMPFFPVGQIRRKGEAGSPYAIRDFKAIAPEYVDCSKKQRDDEAKVNELGRKQFKNLVKKAHELKMRVLIDFVGDHTAVDNVLLDPANPPEKGGYHPEWFLWPYGTRRQILLGDYPLAPADDWTDTAELNYGIPVAGKPHGDQLWYHDDGDRQAMWEYMIGVLEYWVREFDVDGYRCDFAHWVPLEFWKTAISRVKALKPDVAFVAEAYERTAELVQAGFDGIYAFELYNQLKTLHHEVRNGDPYYEVPYIRNKIEWENSHYPAGYRMMRYTENHDEIRATVMYGGIERSQAAFLLALTLPGMPMIYAGQEWGETVRPPLFEGNFEEMTFKPLNRQGNSALEAWYQHVLAIRRDKTALRKGAIHFVNTSSGRVVAFLRQTEKQIMLILVNFNGDAAGEEVHIELPQAILDACAQEGGQLDDVLGKGLRIHVGSHGVRQEVQLHLAPWQSLILELRKPTHPEQAKTVSGKEKKNGKKR